MQNVNNSVVSLFESRDLGTDRAFVNNVLKRGGDALKVFMGQVFKVEQFAGVKQKGMKRVIQAASFALSGNVKDYDEGTAYCVALVMLTNQTTVKFSDAHALMGCTIDGAQHIKGVSRAKLSRFLGRVGTAGTVTSKTSRTVGSGGFFTGLGITLKGDAHSFTLCDGARENPLLLAYAMQLQSMTDSQLELARNK